MLQYILALWRKKHLAVNHQASWREANKYLFVVKGVITAPNVHMYVRSSSACLPGLAFKLLLAAKQERGQ
jgi:hypothetical protein